MSDMIDDLGFGIPPREIYLADVQCPACHHSQLGFGIPPNEIYLADVQCPICYRAQRVPVDESSYRAMDSRQFPCACGADLTLTPAPDPDSRFEFPFRFEVTATVRPRLDEPQINGVPAGDWRGQSDRELTQMLRGQVHSLTEKVGNLSRKVARLEEILGGVDHEMLERYLRGLRRKS